ncbi:U3 small nucleolar ribonucleoprotein IMP4 [Echinococcus granulosus]|uniref:U3 small nucleolar ribonucleoprotein n=1 Tax=Echinococcus granulosus TaxID=6210 RepID=A0A068WMR5_ECHGR|nr:U3 small nucleolar ribonucleoprotein IMP4 [Echinococcus granulosus]CDS21403.1 U3 small nucleolar ribonucleoprotein [Echinococcus granulosus]
MLKRQARLRREFIYRRSIEARDEARKQKRQLIKASLAEGRKLPKEIADEALALNEDLDWSDDGGEGDLRAEDDEYYWAGTEDPRVVVTTSRSPSSKLQEFSKELRHLIPNATKINRGNYLTKDLMDACMARQASESCGFEYAILSKITDMIVINETRGVPDTLIVSHLPFGPTAKFTLFNVLMRHDFEEKGRGSGAKCPQAYPQHLFHGLNTALGRRVRCILKHLFPVPKEETKRVVVWYEDEDIIRFRHHTYKYVNRELEVEEHGPRFDMRLYKIWRGPLHEEDTAEVEWVFRPYMNTAYKRRFLSTEEDEESEAGGTGGGKRLKAL